MVRFLFLDCHEVSQFEHVSFEKIVSRDEFEFDKLYYTPACAGRGCESIAEVLVDSRVA